MEQCFVGLDVSKAETSICMCDENGATVHAVKTVADPDVICQALRKHRGFIQCVVLETGASTTKVNGQKFATDPFLDLLAVDILTAVVENHRGFAIHPQRNLIPHLGLNLPGELNGCLLTIW